MQRTHGVWLRDRKSNQVKSINKDEMAAISAALSSKKRCLVVHFSDGSKVKKSIGPSTTVDEFLSKLQERFSISGLWDSDGSELFGGDLVLDLVNEDDGAQLHVNAMSPAGSGAASAAPAPPAVVAATPSGAAASAVHPIMALAGSRSAANPSSASCAAAVPAAAAAAPEASVVGEADAAALSKAAGMPLDQASPAAAGRLAAGRGAASPAKSSPIATDLVVDLTGGSDDEPTEEAKEEGGAKAAAAGGASLVASKSEAAAPSPTEAGASSPAAAEESSDSREGGMREVARVPPHKLSDDGEVEDDEPMGEAEPEGGGVKAASAAAGASLMPRQAATSAESRPSKRRRGAGEPPRGTRTVSVRARAQTHATPQHHSFRSRALSCSIAGGDSQLRAPPAPPPHTHTHHRLGTARRGASPRRVLMYQCSPAAAALAGASSPSRSAVCGGRSTAAPAPRISRQNGQTPPASNTTWDRRTTSKSHTHC